MRGALELAREVGAHQVLRSNASVVEEIRALTRGVGAQVVLDMVGARRPWRSPGNRSRWTA